MKLELKRDLDKIIKESNLWEIKELKTNGIELRDKLNKYLSEFIEGTLDPDLAGRKPDKFIENIEKGALGDFNDRYILVAYDKDEAVGILIAFPGEKRKEHIYSVHVSPKYRRKGVGEELLIKCINDMTKNNIKELIIDVHIDNVPAYNLYKKLEFKGVDI